MYLALKVVGRREDPAQTQVPSTVPGMPPQAVLGTVSSLLITPVNADGQVPQNAQTLAIPAESLESIAEYITGDVYELVPRA